MPAVHLSRLKKQINELIRSFTDPDRFCIELYHLFEFYADLTYRPGYAVSPPALKPSYAPPVMLIRMLEEELVPLAIQYPLAALNVVDQMWQAVYLEPRLLSVTILGNLPLQPAEEIEKRLLEWASPDLDPRLMAALFNQGSAIIRAQEPQKWISFAENWLESKNITINAMGLRALLPIINPDHDDLVPTIFRLITPFLLTPRPEIQGESLLIIEALAKHTPAEAVFFLRQMVALSTNPATGQLARRAIHFFPEDRQDRLNQSLLELYK